MACDIVKEAKICPKFYSAILDGNIFSCVGCIRQKYKEFPCLFSSNHLRKLPCLSPRDYELIESNIIHGLIEGHEFTVEFPCAKCPFSISNKNKVIKFKYSGGLNYFKRFLYRKRDIKKKIKVKGE